MPDYQKGKIYKITAGDKTYIGSTCEPTLAKRLANHVKNFKRWKQGKMRLTTAFYLIETGQYDITLLELFPCGSKDELSARERFYIETNVCVNKVIPGRTRKEYDETRVELRHDRYKENKEAIRQQQKDYYEKNKEVLVEKKRRYREARQVNAINT
jgi:hypothetical protein